MHIPSENNDMGGIREGYDWVRVNGVLGSLFIMVTRDELCR
jgi:hypothetical protein